MRTTGPQSRIIMLKKRSEWALPANWRELLMEEVYAHCDSQQVYSRGLPKTTVPRPEVYIAKNSGPEDIIQFTLDKDKVIRDRQHWIIDNKLTVCDVNLWPKPKPDVHIGRGGERFLNTGVLRVEHLSRATRHRFNPGRLEGVPGITWDHFEEYEVRRGSARYLGVRTRCGKKCLCRARIENVWMLGWEMFN